MTTHTPEPWRISYERWCEATGVTMNATLESAFQAGWDGADSFRFDDETAAMWYIRRLHFCEVACRDLPNAFLESGGIGRALDAIEHAVNSLHGYGMLTDPAAAKLIAIRKELRKSRNAPADAEKADG